MPRLMNVYGQVQAADRRFRKADAVVFLILALLFYAGVRLALGAPARVAGPAISLSPASLPRYALYSLARMLAAYGLSVIFMLFYGYLAAYNRRAERVLIPLLDVLQSVPILSFLPVVLLSFSAVLPQGVAVEFASVVLIFTSQAWNLTFAWYQSLTTIPKELREASSNFRFNRWMRLKTLELPFAANSLMWNSMMSWAGGWFFLMAAETFTVGERDFRLPGLGSYLGQAAGQSDLIAVGWGLLTLLVLIVALDQFLWRPLLAWSDRFSLEMVESDNPPTSWFYDVVRDSELIQAARQRLLSPLGGRLNARLLRAPAPLSPAAEPGRRSVPLYVVGGVLALGLAYGAYHAGLMLLALPAVDWAAIAVGMLATLARVAAALAIALAWTVPVGLAIGTNERLARWLQPVVQVTASVPATALFPVFVLAVVGVTGGLNLAAILLMLMGTQWYLLFNIIAGAASIPQDLKYTASLLGLRSWRRWRTLLLPALFPYLVTGGITASGGAWNASIVAEYVQFGGRTLKTTGIGSLIAQATAAGNYPLLLAATLSLVLTVVLINRIVWRRLYRLAEDRYRME